MTEQNFSYMRNDAPEVNVNNGAAIPWNGVYAAPNVPPTFMYGGEYYAAPGEQVAPGQIMLNSNMVAEALSAGGVNVNNLSTDGNLNPEITSISVPETEQPIKVKFGKDIAKVTFRKTARDIVPWVAAMLSSVFVDFESMYVHKPEIAGVQIEADLYFYIGKEFQIPTNTEGKPLKTRAVSAVKMSRLLQEQFIQMQALSVNGRPYNLTRAGLDVLSEFLVGYNKKIDAKEQIGKYIGYQPVSTTVDPTGFLLRVMHVDVIKLLQKMIYKSVDGEKVTVGGGSYQGPVANDPNNAVFLFDVCKDEELNKLISQKTGYMPESNVRTFPSISANV